MRKLITSDAFAAARFIKRAELKEELKPIFRLVQETEKKDETEFIEDVGMEVILILINAIGEKKVEEAFYEFIAGPLEISPDEVANLDLAEMIKNLMELFKENDFRSFFNIAGRLN